MRALMLPALLALGACGGSSTVHTCTGMVSGALMDGTFSVCNDFDERYRANLDSWELTAAYTELPTAFTWSTAWTIKGQPKVRSYDQNTMEVQVDCNITVVKAGKRWLARKGAGVPTSGTCSLAIASVDANEAMGNVTTYKLKGSIAAHLEADPGSGSTGTVDTTMDFCEGDANLCPAPTR